MGSEKKAALEIFAQKGDQIAVLVLRKQKDGTKKVIEKKRFTLTLPPKMVLCKSDAFALRQIEQLIRVVVSK